MICMGKGGQWSLGVRLWVRDSERWTQLQRALDWPLSPSQTVQWSMQVTGHSCPCPHLPGLPGGRGQGLPRGPSSQPPSLSCPWPALPRARAAVGSSPHQQALSKKHTQQHVAKCVPVTLAFLATDSYPENERERAGRRCELAAPAPRLCGSRSTRASLTETPGSVWPGRC